MSDLIEEIRNLKKNPQLHSFQEYVAVWNALMTFANEAANEIARLRAEVERLKLEVARGFKVEVVDVTNDPAMVAENVLAQACALLDRISESEQGSELAQEYGQDHPWPQFTRWHDGFHATSKRPMPCKTPLRCLWRWTRKTGAVLDQTGVITDRLQRAEMVVEAARKQQSAYHGGFGVPDDQGCDAPLCKALAAWEEGTA